MRDADGSATDENEVKIAEAGALELLLTMAVSFTSHPLLSS
jgi:hypothetical protein